MAANCRRALLLVLVASAQCQLFPTADFFSSDSSYDFPTDDFGGLTTSDSGFDWGGGSDSGGGTDSTGSVTPFPPIYSGPPTYGAVDLTPTNPPNDPAKWPAVPASFDMYCHDFVEYKGIDCYGGARPNTKCNILYGNQKATDDVDAVQGCTPENCCRTAKVKILCQDSPLVTCTGDDLIGKRKCFKAAQLTNDDMACGDTRCCRKRKAKPTNCFNYLENQSLHCAVVNPGLDWQGKLKKKKCWTKKGKTTMCSLDYCCSFLKETV